MHWTTWILVPVIGAVIGYVTNTIAVAMLFRPHVEKRFLGLVFQGLIPRRQPDLARKIGEVVGEHLLEHQDLVGAFAGLDLRPVVEELVDHGVQSKLQELASMPMIGAFLTPERISGIRGGFVDAILAHKGTLLAHIEKAVEDNLDVSAVVERKVAQFPTPRMEDLVLAVARRELRAIEVWGALLGGLIGLAQVGLLHLL